MKPRRAITAALGLGCYLAAPVFADELRLDGPRRQGVLLVGRVDPGAAIARDGVAVRVSPEGLFPLSFGRDARARVKLSVRTRSDATE